MIVSLSWLKEYVPIEMSASDLAAKLTMAGLEVEAVKERYAYLKQVLVGRIAAVRPHPNADKLQCCDVDLGDRMVAVVCGAPNVSVDMLAPLALPGTVFPDKAPEKAAEIPKVISAAEDVTPATESEARYQESTESRRKRKISEKLAIKSPEETSKKSVPEHPAVTKPSSKKKTAESAEKTDNKG